MYDDNADTKYIPKNKLIKLLQRLPDDSLICTNDVENLSIVSQEIYIGYIDMGPEELELF